MSDAELRAIRDRIVEGIPITSDHWKGKLLEALELVRERTRLTVMRQVAGRLTSIADVKEPS